MNLSYQTINDPLRVAGFENDQLLAPVTEEVSPKGDPEQMMRTKSPPVLPVDPPRTKDDPTEKDKDDRTFSNRERAGQENNRRLEEISPVAEPIDTPQLTGTGHKSLFIQRSPEISHFQDPKVKRIPDTKKAVDPTVKEETRNVQNTGEVAGRTALGSQNQEPDLSTRESLASPLLSIQPHEPSAFKSQPEEPEEAIKKYAKKIITRQLADLSKDYLPSKPLERGEPKGHELPGKRIDQKPEKVVIEKIIVKEIHHKPEPRPENDSRRRDPSPSPKPNPVSRGPLSKLRFGLGQM